MIPVSIFWHRRDLRLEDNAGLFHALTGEYPVLPLFIFDSRILDDLDNKKDARVTFIHNHISALDRQLRKLGSGLLVKHGDPVDIWKQLFDQYDIRAVFTNHDYEPYAIQRDREIEAVLKNKGIAFHHFKDQVIFEKQEVAKADGNPYTVFTPYSRKWRVRLQSEMTTFSGENGREEAVSIFLKPYECDRYFANFFQTNDLPSPPSLAKIGFQYTDIELPPETVTRQRVRNYDKTRDFPAIEGTSRLGIHFRFGTISIREKVRLAQQLNDTFLNELIWREFYAMILANFPYVAERAFRPEYDFIEWRNDKEEFQRWCEGKTGYPIVDAGMRQLNATGYMHNRVRMITASFLTKHLLIDWRWGEAYFAAKLLDYEMASNNGGWQWAAGCGTDAAPYFRIFNPIAQQQKFDKDLTYVRRWVPEYGTSLYPEPVVDHVFARQRCLKVYKERVEKGRGMGGV